SSGKGRTSTSSPSTPARCVSAVWAWTRFVNNWRGNRGVSRDREKYDVSTTAAGAAGPMGPAVRAAAFWTAVRSAAVWSAAIRWPATIRTVTVWTATVPAAGWCAVSTATGCTRAVLRAATTAADVWSAAVRLSAVRPTARTPRRQEVAYRADYRVASRGRGRDRSRHHTPAGPDRKFRSARRRGAGRGSVQHKGCRQGVRSPV